MLQILSIMASAIGTAVRSPPSSASVPAWRAARWRRAVERSIVVDRSSPTTSAGCDAWHGLGYGAPSAKAQFEHPILWLEVQQAQRPVGLRLMLPRHTPANQLAEQPLRQPVLFVDQARPGGD